MSSSAIPYAYQSDPGIFTALTGRIEVEGRESNPVYYYVSSLDDRLFLSLFPLLCFFSCSIAGQDPHPRSRGIFTNLEIVGRRWKEFSGIAIFVRLHPGLLCPPSPSHLRDDVV